MERGMGGKGVQGDGDKDGVAMWAPCHVCPLLTCKGAARET